MPPAPPPAPPFLHRLRLLATTRDMLAAATAASPNYAPLPQSLPASPDPASHAAPAAVTSSSSLTSALRGVLSRAVGGQPQPQPVHSALSPLDSPHSSGLHSPSDPWTDQPHSLSSAQLSPHGASPMAAIDAAELGQLSPPDSGSESPNRHCWTLLRGLVLVCLLVAAYMLGLSHQPPSPAVAPLHLQPSLSPPVPPVISSSEPDPPSDALSRADSPDASANSAPLAPQPMQPATPIASSDPSPQPPAAVTPAATSPTSGAPVASASPAESACSGCIFPRPPAGVNSDIYITAKSNPGAGAGHQFSEWIVGPYLALKYNLTYVWSALGYQSVGWNSFLGLSTGELTREQINSTGALRVRELPAPTKQNPRVEHEVWLQQQLAEEHARRQTDGAGAANSTAPTPLLLHLQEPAIRVMQRMCLPALRSVVRRKYCEARLAHPVSENLFEEDRAAGRLVVAWHLRCGNSCFNPLRATPLDSVLRTTLQMQRILARLSPDREVAWHIFTQPPQNMTAEAHFGPMLEKMKPHLTHLRTHWHDSAQVVFHHLVQSDVFLGSWSSFSWLVMVHHPGLVVTPAVGSCSANIPYDRQTGEVDGTALEQDWQRVRALMPTHVPARFNNEADCRAIDEP